MKKKEKTAKVQEKKQVGLLDVIKYPIVTEKSTNLSAHNQVVFAVCKTATKPEIKSAIEQIFGVSVKAVNTLVRKGKEKRFKGRAGIQEDVKRAIITLNDGQQLDLGSGI
ncbi:MAG: 50S ribosomal protein L23 [Alphaproteobacteria bacterium]|nr:50S ribosomal protein L23 [Alphaproteobacteria bacterium]